MKYAVMIDVDGDMMYVPEGSVFPNFPKPKLFDSYEDAEEERAKWNTGVIVDFETGERDKTNVNISQEIRPFDPDERDRAKERAKINKCLP